MKKKKYTPKWIRTNTLELVADRIRPVTSQGSWMLDRGLQQSNALLSLTSGSAVRAHISALMAAHNMSVAMQKHKTGSEYESITNDSSKALQSLCERFSKIGRYVATAEEITALQRLLDLNRAQYEVLTVGEAQKAYEYASRVHACTALKSKFILGEPA